MKNNFKIHYLVIPLFTLLACNNSKSKEKTLPNYDLSKPEKFAMPESLLEISGIAFYNGVNDTVYAIQDEDGKVFKLPWNNKQKHQTKFGKKGDFEDITIINNKVFVLKSNGILYSFDTKETSKEETNNAKEWTNLLPKEEYEGMYGDATTGNLYILCKSCSDDNSKEKVSGYVLHVSDSIKLTGNFTIDVTQIKKNNGKIKGGFRPSALVKNNNTNQWYILSSANKLLIIADIDWKIINVVSLNGNTFNQPEGIAFDKENNLYISNEGDDLVDGNILKFKYIASIKK